MYFKYMCEQGSSAKTIYSTRFIDIFVDVHTLIIHSHTYIHTHVHKGCGYFEGMDGTTDENR